jgi:hypothetical protein
MTKQNHGAAKSEAPGKQKRPGLFRPRLQNIIRFKMKQPLTAAIFSRSPFSAVKGHSIEFLVSNILVTSLSSYFGALPRQRDHFTSAQLLIVSR